MGLKKVYKHGVIYSPKYEAAFMFIVDVFIQFVLGIRKQEKLVGEKKGRNSHFWLTLVCGGKSDLSQHCIISQRP